MRAEMEGLSILVIGIGDFFTKYYYHTGFVILLDGRPVLVDCQDPLPKALHDASLQSGIEIGLDDIDHLILTHIHGDHANGLESLGFYNHFTRSRRTTIYTIAQVSDTMWDQKLRASMSPQTDENYQKIGELSLKDYFEIILLQPGVTHDILGMEIEIRLTKHYVPCFGFRISYKGRSLGYSSDTTFDPEHIRFLENCNLIIHETNRAGHTEYEKLLELPEAVRQRMLLIHIPDDFRADSSEIPVAREGAIYYV